MGISQGTRKDANLHPERRDIYRERARKAAPSVCTGCGAFYQAGRWTWNEPPPEAERTLCPACRRVKDNYPAGTMELKGAFLAEHRREIESLIRHEEEAERSQHPLERIIALRVEGESTLVTTTGVHLARRIGEALTRAYQGEIDFRYGDGEGSVRVTWSR